MNEPSPELVATIAYGLTVAINRRGNTIIPALADEYAEMIAKHVLASPHVMTWEAAQKKIENAERKARQQLDRATTVQVQFDEWKYRALAAFENDEAVRERLLDAVKPRPR